MTLTLIRDIFTPKSTTGTLYIDDSTVKECFILEDVVRAIKIPKETAIPMGTYEIVPHESPHLKQVVPMLVNVPDYSLVYIHWGNKPEDTDGCLLTGLTRDRDWIGFSKIAYGSLFAKIEKAWKTSGVKITITVKDKSNGRGV